MYFFIAFVAATFGLLYAYFKMNQKAEEDAWEKSREDRESLLKKVTKRISKKIHSSIS